MNVSVGKRWEEFVSALVAEGRYGSSSEVVREGLRLVEEREQKLQALREMVNRSIEEGGEVTEEEIDAALDEVAAELTREGYR
jgi:antitoxin ParD1/3/4